MRWRVRPHNTTTDHLTDTGHDALCGRRLASYLVILEDHDARRLCPVCAKLARQGRLLEVAS